VSCAKGIAVFAAAKTSGRIRRCGGDPPRALPHKPAAGRWRSHRARETGKKKDLKSRDELARTFGFRSFFDKPAETSPPKDWLSGGF